MALTWQEVLDHLENDRAAVTLTSIDFEKAFNRMDHHQCLKALSDHNASPATIALVSAFLCKRTMSVRVGNQYSDPRPVQGGSPQGSILGNYLFCLTTDALGERDEEAERIQTTSTPAKLKKNIARTTFRLPESVHPSEVPEITGLDDDVDPDSPIAFFRVRDRQIFDSSDDDTYETLDQDGID